MNGNLSGGTDRNQKVTKGCPVHQYLDKGDKMQTEIQPRPYGYIYKITNKTNGKCYIGQTIDLPSHRWHKYKRLKCKKQPKIYNALKKYGPDNFIYEIFDTAQDQMKLDYLEDFHIKNLNTIEGGYNCRPGGGAYGKMSDETKRKLSQINTGRIGFSHTAETKRMISEYHKGRTHSTEHIQKMKAKLTGMKRTEEYKIKQSERITKWWAERKQLATP